MKYHELKTISPYFDDVASGAKRFEIRRHDRDFERGDLLILREYDPKAESYSGRTLYARVVLVYYGGDLGPPGLKEDYCLMSIEVIEEGSR